MQVNCLSKEKDVYRNEISTEYDAIKENYLNRRSVKDFISLEDARNNFYKIDWDQVLIHKANQLGYKFFEEININTIRKYIDWTPFFFTWEMRKKYEILNDEIFGEQALQLFDNANKMIDNIIKNNWVEVKAVIGIWEAKSEGDDVHLFENDKQIATYNFLRQQAKEE